MINFIQAVFIVGTFLFLSVRKTLYTAKSLLRSENAATLQHH